MSYRLEWRKEVVIWHLDGEISSDDLLDANTAVCAHPRIRDMKAQLVLFSDASRVSVSGQAMKGLAIQDAQLAKKIPGMKVAVVATNPVAIGLSRMYELSSPPTSWDSDIFTTRKEAEAWINLPIQAFSNV